MLRRDFLRFSTQLALVGILPACAHITPKKKDPILYACAKKQDQYFLVGSDLQGNTLSQFLLPARGHGVAIDNANSKAVVFARRPENYLVQFSPETGKEIYSYHLEEGKHFFGHGCFDQEGLLYSSEGDSLTSETSICIYHLKDKITKIGEFSGFGLGGHEIVMHPDNQHLVLALGGIKTNAREKLNLETMQPALLYIDKNNGKIKQQITIDDNQLSIRHLSVNQNGVVAFACQYQGSDEIRSLVYHHQLGDKQALALGGEEEEWLRFDDYIGSITINDHQIIATSPRGNCYATWDINTKEIQKIKLVHDVCGIVMNHDTPTLSSGNGELGGEDQMQKTDWHWDNHMGIWLG